MNIKDTRTKIEPLLNYQTFMVEFYPEIHCEECREIVHNHFNCPVCKDPDAATDRYSSFYGDDDIIFSCEECNTKFKIINLGYRESEIEVVK